MCKWHSKNNAYSKNNVIASFYKQKLPFSPLCNLLVLTFWHSSIYWLFRIPPLIAYFREVFPFPYQKGRDKGMKLWLNNWIPKALIKPSKFSKRKPIKHWHYRLKWAQLWNKFLLGSQGAYIKYVGRGGEGGWRLPSIFMVVPINFNFIFKTCL